MVTMNQPIMLLLTVIQISNKNLKFQLSRVVYQCLRNICTKFQVDTSFLFWVFLNNLTSIYSIWQRPWNHSTNIFIRIFLLHRIHWLKWPNMRIFGKNDENGSFPWLEFFFTISHCKFLDTGICNNLTKYELNRTDRCWEKCRASYNHAQKSQFQKKWLKVYDQFSHCFENLYRQNNHINWSDSTWILVFQNSYHFCYLI